MKILNEDDLLKYLIKNIDSNRRCNLKKLNLDEMLDVQTQSNYLSSLKCKGYISVYIGGDTEVHSKGISYAETFL